ncbi:MAG TPA: protein kinase, partial [Dehalococcoidia bacterium]|nr:protein kinase [Dehalococcoidia bacterium]
MIRRLLAGRYLILSEIGAGGMGTVYRARDQATQRLVAIKVLHPHLRREASYVQRLRREAQIALTLDSRHIVQVIDYGQEGDAFYLVMEYVEGVNLRELLRRGKLEGATAVRIAAHIARALEEAHEKRIVHRDIKPQNVIVGPHGDAKVADFGIARVEGLTTLTDTGSLIGSAHYMAPETFRGHGDRRSDLYSLGAVLYEMLTGRVPFPGETPFDVVRAQLEDEAPPLRELLPDIDEELASLVGSLLAKDPSRRPGTAQEARAVLERLLAEQDTRRLGVRRGRIGSLFAFASRPFAAAGRGASRLAQPRYALAIAFLVGTVAVAVTGAVLLTGASGNGGDTAVQPSPTPTVGPISTCEIDAPLPLAAVAGACAGAAIEFHRDCPRGYACAVRRQAGALVLEANDRTIAFIDDGGNLAVARENGSEVVRLTAHGRASEPAWSPDGRYLVYVYTETAPEDPSRNLYQLRIIDVDNPTLDGILL